LTPCVDKKLRLPNIFIRKYSLTQYKYEIFSAFKLTSYKDCKVVILGQDPYHGENQAHGLAFSVKKGVALPPLK
jgi:uracil-DNA glycosylase